MANRGDRGGSKTRANIAAVATRLFLDRGFDEVTIADVAKAAGVSRVTVFSYFDKKEDLILDRLPEVLDTMRAAMTQRPNCDPIEALRLRALELADQRHPLSGLTEGAEPFVRVLLASPALIARLRAFERQIEDELASHLRDNPRFVGDSALAAALLVAAYRTVAVNTIRQRLAGAGLDGLAASHRRRLNQAVATVTRGLSATASE